MSTKGIDDERALGIVEQPLDGAANPSSEKPPSSTSFHELGNGPSLQT